MKTKDVFITIKVNIFRGIIGMEHLRTSRTSLRIVK